MTVLSQTDGQVDVTWFLDSTGPAPGASASGKGAGATPTRMLTLPREILVAAAVWRYPGEPFGSFSWRSIRWDWVWALVKHVIFRRPLPKPAVPASEGPRWRPPVGWSSSASGPGGQRAKLYSSEQRVLRILERDYPLPPPGNAIVLLVDEETHPDEPPGVTVRTVPVSPLPPNVIDLDAIRDKRSRKRNTHHETVREACLKSIRQDPEVRAFLDRKPVRPA